MYIILDYHMYYQMLLTVRLKGQHYFSTVHSCMQSCLLVWGVTPKHNLDRLYIMQKKNTRFIQNISSRDHRSPYFAENRIPHIEMLYKQRLLELIFLELKANCEVFFHTYANAETPHHFRNKSFVTIKMRTRHGMQLLKWLIPNLLDCYPSFLHTMESSPSLLAFSKLTKMYFLQQLQF